MSDENIDHYCNELHHDPLVTSSADDDFSWMPGAPVIVFALAAILLIAGAMAS